MKKAASIPSDSYFDNKLTGKFQLIVLADEENVAQKDLAFATKTYEKLQKEKAEVKVTVAEKAAEAVSEVKEIFYDLTGKTLTAINGLLAPVTNISNYDLSDELIEETITEMVQALTAALNPFLELQAMPDIPLLGSLQDIVNSIKDLARIQKETKKYLHSKNQQGQSEVETREPWTQRIKNSKIGELGKDLVKLLIVLAQQLVLFILFFIYNFLSELIELLKPIFDAFGIIAGTFIGMLSKLKDVLGCVWNIGGLILLIMKIIWQKVQSIWNLFSLFNPESTDDQIDAMRRMIAENKVRLEYCALNKDAAVAKAQLEDYNSLFNVFDSKKPEFQEKLKNAEKNLEEKRKISSEFKSRIETRINEEEEKLMGAGATPG